MPFKGVYEVNHDKQIVWSYLTDEVSHDADRLPNGNTIMVWGWDENKDDAQVKEVDSSGNLVWSWHAADHLSYEDIQRQDSGFTHTNSAVRLDNGNTLISIRNLNMLVEVEPSGGIVWSLRDVFESPHDPEILPNGNILVASRQPHQTMEVSRNGDVVWRYSRRNVKTIRYNHQLPNGNIILTDRSKIIEITRAGKTVWQLELLDTDPSDKWMYKAERMER